jgi:hypothetical protein
LYFPVSQFWLTSQRPFIEGDPETAPRSFCLCGLASGASLSRSPEIDFSVFPMEPPVLPLCANAAGVMKTAPAMVKAMSTLFTADPLFYFETNFS